ncbi:putative membrane protein [Bacillus thermophilus]|uniref:Membrane protein n=1 Tax=Siminovitchia thermophila TaxID=1245522 RepID=A0ABS2R985_9BACI|nr:DUF1700 domain-containing protein [Siminovitchia thermophila]MBM7716207.1 putative membrane protein [Siminovitchia thermophila]ONK21450.1 hypothetical protein BLX87_21530 [Bacillus sp. VT-16-64]
MTRNEFLKVLNSTLQNVPEEERLDIIQDFKEYFDAGQMEGKTEEQISTSLGSPRKIAKELLASYHLEKVEATASAGNIMRAVWAVIGLGFFNVVIVLGPFVAVAGIVVAAWITGAAFILSPLLVLANTIIFPGTFMFFDLFSSLALAGIGIFIVIGMYFATQAISSGFIRYLKFNMRIVKGGLKRD